MFLTIQDLGCPVESDEQNETLQLWGELTQ